MLFLYSDSFKFNYTLHYFTDCYYYCFCTCSINADSFSAYHLNKPWARFRITKLRSYVVSYKTKQLGFYLTYIPHFNFQTEPALSRDDYFIGVKSMTILPTIVRRINLKRLNLLETVPERKQKIWNQNSWIIYSLHI